MKIMKNLEKAIGTSIPLGAIYTEKKDGTVIGEYTDLPEFAKFCKKAGFTLLQLLPVNDTGTQSSPYSGLSAFALHPIFIDIRALPEFEAAYKDDAAFKKAYDKMLKDFPYSQAGRFNYMGILNAKTALLNMLYEKSEVAKTGEADEALAKWIKKNSWIISYAVYKNLKVQYNQASWKEWKKSDQLIGAKEIKKRWSDKSMAKAHLFFAWTQMRANEQFKAATDAVKKAGIILKGDMPILMNEDSCDAWAEPDIFNHNLRAGSPVDGENPTGQNWGFPTYNWENLKARKYDWWIDRLKNAEQYYGAYRLDHILGFFRIWAIPARDTTAILGHTVPYVPMSRDDLHNIGFDDGRIRWLSQPHVNTGLIEDITWNHQSATSILSKFMDRIGNEELWLFKSSITGDKDIYEADLSAFCEGDAAQRCKDALSKAWQNRCLIEVTPDHFVPVWTYYTSTAWGTLNDGEKNALKNLISGKEWEQNKLWETQSDEILSTLTKSVKMVPCGEDLGAELPCLPHVMEKNGILGLRVNRWTRRWSEGGQPYVPMNQITYLSVTTTSVHDSTTVRQWWQEDRSGASLFVRTNPWAFGVDGFDSGRIDQIANSPFSPEIAESYLKGVATANSVWIINPLQDYMSMEQKYWLADSNAERVNVPGSVNDFNWTYRMPVTVETLEKDDSLIGKIKNIVAMHR